ncbi:MAG TPA: class I SAM-dependent methyltransferase [Anaerolineales bacterium]|nr:class I SAM-dependent methyltransferase [Anaerolineales bacterium]
MESTKIDYGNWVSKKFILVPGLLGLFFAGLSFLVPFLAVFAILFLAVGLYFILARQRFSPAGGDVQSQIVGLILERLDWDGRGQAIDIGCGNAPLTVRLARRYPSARVTGVDYWGANWDYSKQVCERNARIEGVGDRTDFQKASASALPFADGAFGLAVSNLTFHEVSDAKDKRDVLKEALRVVKPGGKFVFQDLFLWEAIYGKPDDLVALVRSWGVRNVEFVDTHEAPFIPSLLKLPFMVGKIAILRGEK